MAQNNIKGKKLINLNITSKEQIQQFLMIAANFSHPFNINLDITLSSQQDYDLVTRAFTAKNPEDLDYSVTKSMFFQEAQLLSTEGNHNKPPLFSSLLYDEAPGKYFYKKNESGSKPPGLGDPSWDELLNNSTIHEKKNNKFYDEFKYAIDWPKRSSKAFEDKNSNKYENQKEIIKFNINEDKGVRQYKQGSNVGEAKSKSELEKKYCTKFCRKGENNKAQALVFVDDEELNSLMINGIPISDKKRVNAQTKKFMLAWEHLLFIFRFKLEEMMVKAKELDCIIKRGNQTNLIEIAGEAKGAQQLIEFIYKLVLPMDFGKIEAKSDCFTRNLIENLKFFKSLKRKNKIEIEIIKETSDEKKSTKIILYGEKLMITRAQDELRSIKIEFLIWEEMVSKLLRNAPKEPNKKGIENKTAGNLIGNYFNQILMPSLKEKAKELKISYIEYSFKKKSSPSTEMLTFTFPDQRTNDFRALIKEIELTARKIIILQVSRKTGDPEKALKYARQLINDNNCFFSSAPQKNEKKFSHQEKVKFYLVSETERILSLFEGERNVFKIDSSLFLENIWKVKIYSLSFPGVGKGSQILARLKEEKNSIMSRGYYNNCASLVVNSNIADRITKEIIMKFIHITESGKNINEEKAIEIMSSEDEENIEIMVENKDKIKKLDDYLPKPRQYEKQSHKQAINKNSLKTKKDGSDDSDEFQESVFDLQTTTIIGKKDQNIERAAKQDKKPQIDRMLISLNSDEEHAGENQSKIETKVGLEEHTYPKKGVNDFHAEKGRISSSTIQNVNLLEFSLEENKKCSEQRILSKAINNKNQAQFAIDNNHQAEEGIENKHQAGAPDANNFSKIKRNDSSLLLMESLLENEKSSYPEDHLESEATYLCDSIIREGGSLKLSEQSNINCKPDDVLPKSKNPVLMESNKKEVLMPTKGAPSLDSSMQLEVKLKEGISAEPVANYLYKNIKNTLCGIEDAIIDVQPEEEAYHLVWDVLKARGLKLKEGFEMKQIFRKARWEDFESWHSFSDDQGLHLIAFTESEFPTENTLNINSHIDDYLQTTARKALPQGGEKQSRLWQLLDEKNFSRKQEPRGNLLLCLYSGNLLKDSGTFESRELQYSEYAYPCIYVIL